MPSRILLILSAVAAFSSAANAQTVLYDNHQDAITAYYSVGSQGPLYNSFSTGSSTALLTDVKLSLETLSGVGSTSMTVGLYADSSSFPGAQIQVIGTLNVGAPGLYDFPVNPAISLNANTRYWIGVSGPGNSIAGWAWTGNTSGTGNIANEFYCYSSVVSRPTAVPGRPQARGASVSFGCYSNGETQDPFLMTVTAGSAAAAPALSFTGITVLALLLAASAVLFLRRNQPTKS
jgi:hypothetical protein